MIEVIIGYPRNIPNPNSDGMRSNYEKVEKVKGEKVASRDTNREEGVVVGNTMDLPGQSKPLWDWRNENYDAERYLVGDLMC